MMENESDIIEALNSVGYAGKSTQNNILEEALIVGPKSENFRELVTWLTYELHVLKKTDEKVENSCDLNEFSMELSSLLKEIGCPYIQFVAGPLSGKFQTRQSRILLLDYLITELMTAKMCLKLQPEKDASYVIPKVETNTARTLENITKELALEKPPENISAKAFFDKIAFKLEEAVRAVNERQLCKPLLTLANPLTDEQWVKLEKIQKDLDNEYNIRKKMQFTRLEVTVQSFQWSDNAKKRENDIVREFQKKTKEMEPYKCSGRTTDIAALLAARSDLAIIEKTSSANVRANTATQLQKHVIGMVPDRGGRANEHAPPPPEMPAWQQQRSSGPGGRGGGGNFQTRGGARGGRGGSGGGGHSGGHSGGIWSQQPPQIGGFNQSQGGGGFQPQYKDNRGGGGGQQRQQYDQPRNEYWVQGGSRVQGGWSQRGNDRVPYQHHGDNRGGSQSSCDSAYRDGNDGGGGNAQYNRNVGGYNNRGGSGGRGKSNYSRGGGGGGGGGYNRR